MRHIREKLDTAFCDSDGQLLHPKAHCLSLPRLHSDHHPIIHSDHHPIIVSTAGWEPHSTYKHSFFSPCG